jgi:hypothetical protein
MTILTFIKKVPASILGVGSFEPQEGGREYPLPDDVAAGLIATKDPDWAPAKSQQNHSDEDASQNEEGPRSNKRRK